MDKKTIRDVKVTGRRVLTRTDFNEPLDEKTGHLIQLGAAAAIHSIGSVRSHAARALAAGATLEEIRHAIIILTSTIGFPTVAAALSWVDDAIEKKA